MKVQDIIDFCEGSLLPDAFHAELMKPDAEKLFEDSPPIPPYAKSSGMVYYYLIEQDYNNIGNLLNVQNCLVQFLQKKGVSVSPSEDFDKLYNITLKAQPSWLSAPQDYLSFLLKGKKGSDAEKINYLKEQLLSNFQYMKKPPRWVQAPAWPIIDGNPLFFVGQMDITPLSHDKAQLFVFYDKKYEKFHNIVQNM